MNPWDEFAAKFGEAEATRRLGPRPAERQGPPPSPSREDVGGYVRAAGQGVFGLGDEIRSGAAALGAMWPGGRSPGEAWTETMASEKAAQDEWAAANPGRNIGAQVVGGLATGMGAGRLLAGAPAAIARVSPAAAEVAGTAVNAARASTSTPARLLKGMGAAGAAGALTSAGLAEGGAMDRLEATPAGFGWGAGTAAAFGVGGRAAGLAADALDIRTPEGVRARAREILLDWMGVKDELPVDAVAERVGRLRGPVTVAEGAGPNTQRLVATIEAKPGPGATRLRGALTSRQGQAPARVDEAIRRAAGADVGDLEGTIESMRAAQKAEGDRLYGAARSAGDLQSDELVAFLNSDRPALRAAIGKVSTDYANAGKKLPPLDGSAPIPLQAVDDIKGALDHIARWGVDGQTRQARASDSAVRGIVGEMFDIVDPMFPGGEYKAARSAWSASEGAQEAFEEGYKAFSGMEPEAVARRMQDQNADAFRLGVARYMREVGGLASDRSGSQDVARRLMGSSDRQLWAPGLESKVRAVFGNSDPEDFLRTIESEGAMNQTFRQMSGSRTMPLAEAGTELERGIGVAEDMGRAARGDIGAVASLLRGVAQSRAAGFNRRTMQELADMMTAGIESPQDLQNLLDELRAAERLRNQASRGVTAGVAGGLAGGGGL